MSDVETEVSTVLRAIEALDGRAYPGVIEQASPLPAVGFVATRAPLSTMAGELYAQAVTLTVTICAETFAQARAVAADVRLAMRDATTFIKRLTEEPGDEFDPESRRYLYHLIYLIWERQGETSPLPALPESSGNTAGDEIVRRAAGVRRWTGTESPTICAIVMPSQDTTRGLVEIVIDGVITNGSATNWRDYRAIIYRDGVALRPVAPVQTGVQAGEKIPITCTVLDEPDRTQHTYTLTITQDPAGDDPSVARLSLTLTQYQ